VKKPNIQIECPNCSQSFALEQVYTSQIEERMKAEFAEREAELRKRIQEETQDKVSVELKDLQEQLNEKSTMLKAAHQQELEVRKRLRLAEEKEKNIEIEIQRRLGESVEEFKKRSEEQFLKDKKLLLKEHSTVVESLKHKVEDLTRKLSQGSQQTQGEALELVLEDDLKLLFPSDSIEPVPKGVSGADILQTVNNRFSQNSGSLLWEFKNTKTWSDAWVQKLKDDQRSLKADISIILTSTLPKGVKGFSFYNGVWVTDLHSYVGLCTALRHQLLQAHSARQANVGKNEKMETLYHYLSGNEFKQRVQTIIEAFSSMKEQLEKERVAMTRIWAKREKELDRVLAGTAGMYGDLEGIVGNTLQKVEGLEVFGLPDRETANESLQQASSNKGARINIEAENEEDL
jgi:hypothetical protein